MVYGARPTDFLELGLECAVLSSAIFLSFRPSFVIPASEPESSPTFVIPGRDPESRNVKPNVIYVWLFFTFWIPGQARNDNIKMAGMTESGVGMIKRFSNNSPSPTSNKKHPH